MTIQIEIVDKVASVIGTPIIVCGNDDYKVRFIFDDEWLDKAVKTARFKWTTGGENKHIDVPFTGSTVDVPKLSNITVVQIGVYAGDLQTTTPARVPCVKSILCGGGTHADPTPDVYDQLIQLIEDSAVQTPVTLAVEERNSGAPFTFWIGKQAEYEALAETVDNCLYIITDSTPAGAVYEQLEILVDGFKLLGTFAELTTGSPDLAVSTNLFDAFSSLFGNGCYIVKIACRVTDTYYRYYDFLYNDSTPLSADHPDYTMQTSHPACSGVTSCMVPWLDSHYAYILRGGYQIGELYIPYVYLDLINRGTGERETETLQNVSFYAKRIF